MSDFKENPQSEAIRTASEKKNPYAGQCPNRHLWSEGYRTGYDDAITKLQAEIKNLKDAAADIDRCISQGLHILPDSAYHFGLKKVLKKLEDQR